MDNTTFGGDVPTVPLWSGPPRTIVQVQAILYASLAASLLSALLAMLGKQWLNRYASTDVRGTAIDRSQNRQRKLNGVVDWYFYYVMESLPLMLQAALFLLGCALSRYLWEIDTTVASVIIGFTSFGILFYLFIVVAGAASVNCPYQTPGAYIIRHILSCIPRHIFSRILSHTLPRVLDALLSVSRALYASIKGSHCCVLLIRVWNRFNWIWVAVLFLPVFLIGLAMDTCHLGQAIVMTLVVFPRRMRGRLPRGSFTLKRRLDVLDLDCISWVLKTSLDRAVHLSTLDYLATVTGLAECDPYLVLGCLNVLISCVEVTTTHVAIVPGLEQIAKLAAAGFFHTFSHLSFTGPTSGGFADIRQHYSRVFPQNIDFSALPFSRTFGVVHGILYPKWRNYQRVHESSGQEHLTVISTVTKLAQSRYRGQRKVPRWTLRFALHFLSQDPLPPTSIVVDCLSIIAIDLDCEVPSTRPTTLDEGYVRI